VRIGIQYQRSLLWVAFPAYTVFYLITAYYAGLYDRWYKRLELVQSTFVATTILLAGYALLPERFRFSRGILLFGSLACFCPYQFIKVAAYPGQCIKQSREGEENASTLIVASRRNTRKPYN
jgi:hypothetical protein